MTSTPLSFCSALYHHYFPENFWRGQPSSRAPVIIVKGKVSTSLRPNSALSPFPLLASSLMREELSISISWKSRLYAWWLIPLTNRAHQQMYDVQISRPRRGQSVNKRRNAIWLKNLLWVNPVCSQPFDQQNQAEGAGGHIQQ